MPTLELDRKKRDQLLRKTDILKAAEHVFAVKGYYRATVADIAEEAQYAVGTLYLYFKDKQSLYVNLFEEKMKELLSLIQQQVDQTDDAFGKIKILVKTQLEFFLNNEDFFRIFFSEREGLRWKVKDRIPTQVIDLQLKFLDYITDLIKQAQSEQIITKEYHPQKVASILSAIIHSIIMPRLILSTKQKEDILNQDSFVLEVFLQGVGVR